MFFHKNKLCHCRTKEHIYSGSDKDKDWGLGSILLLHLTPDQSVGDYAYSQNAVLRQGIWLYLEEKEMLCLLICCSNYKEKIT